MSFLRFDARWRYHDCRVLRLECDLLRVDVLPECGGKILHLVHKPQDRDYLWQHPTINPARLPAACNYDDNFCGGWDDCFPSVSPGLVGGESYPDHGEYWTREFDWQVNRSGDSLTLYLSARGGVTPTRMEKWLTIEAGSTALKIRHRITHLGEHPFEFMWSQHPPLVVGPTHEYIIPAGRGIVGSPDMSRLGPQWTEFTWPHVPGHDGRPIDASKVPASTDRPGYEMLYLTELKAEWYAVIDRSTRSGFGLAFDRDVFRALWLFATYGGWRGLHLAIIEPCTSWPYELGRAAAGRQMRIMKPGQIIDVQTTAMIFTDRDGVERIDVDGSVY